MLENILVFFVSFFIVFLLTPFIRALGLKFSAIDRTNKRKVHVKVITKLGGVGIYAGIIGASVLPLILQGQDYKLFLINFVFYVFISTIILILGIFDDIRGANAYIKFSVQALVSVICIKFGYFIQGISFGVFEITNIYVMYFFTILWISGVINAVNLIDGLDGLACGISGIASFVYGIILIYYGYFFEATIAFALFGGCVGFLKYNFYPAKIFMGDAGSLFIGLLLSLLSIKIANINANKLGIFLPVLIMAVPLFDMVRVFFLRLMKKKHPFQADKSHIHHLLMRYNFSHRNAVLIICLFSFFMGVAGVLIIIGD